jgi:uncharacterized protein YukE
MSDQIKSKVDKGQLLNYDTCFLDSAVAQIAAQKPVSNDDLNSSLAKDRICRIFYNNAFWRGGINSSIDDRIPNLSKSGWNTTAAETSQNTRSNLNSEFSTLVNRVRQAIVSQHVYGSANDISNVTNTKSDIERNIQKFRDENSRLQNILNDLKSENSEELLQQVADKEERLRKVKTQNAEYKQGNELRREQSKDLYNRFNSNYHSSAFGYFGYNPLNASTQSGLLFTSYFMGFIGLIVLGIQVGPILLGKMSSFSSPAQISSFASKNTGTVKSLY